METFIDELSRKQKKVLNHFLENPTEETHLRGLAKKTGVSHTWVKKTIEEFQEKGLLTIEKTHDLKIKAERENELFKTIKRSRNLLKLYDLAQYLEKEYRHPEAIIAFGSYARGEDTERSDIDIAVIGKKGEVNVAKFEEQLGKEISLQAIEEPTEDFKETLNNGIVLKGYLG